MLFLPLGDCFSRDYSVSYCTDCSIREYQLIFKELSWDNHLAYAFNYEAIYLDAIPSEVITKDEQIMYTND